MGKNSYLTEGDGFILFPNAASCAFFALVLFLSCLLFFFYLYSDCFVSPLVVVPSKLLRTLKSFRFFVQALFLVSEADYTKIER